MVSLGLTDYSIIKTLALWKDCCVNHLHSAQLLTFKLNLNLSLIHLNLIIKVLFLPNLKYYSGGKLSSAVWQICTSYTHRPSQPSSCNMLVVNVRNAPVRFVGDWNSSVSVAYLHVMKYKCCIYFISICPVTWSTICYMGAFVNSAFTRITCSFSI